MPTLFVAVQGAHITREGERIVVSLNHRKLSELHIMDVDQVVIFGEVEITTPAMVLCVTRQIDVVLLSVTGRYKGSLRGRFHKNIGLRQRQFAAVLGSEDLQDGVAGKDIALELSRAFVYGKSANSAALLLRAARYRDMDGVRELASEIKTGLADIRQASSLSSLRGYEGALTRLYFSGLRQLLDSGFSFKKRIRRPPTDPINVLLSLGYTILAEQINSIVAGTGFDPYLGFYHAAKYGRPALALDLMEEFRPVLVDACVLSAVNKGVIKPSDFRIRNDHCHLGRSGLGRFLALLNRYFARKTRYGLTNNKISYRVAIQKQCRLLARVLSGKEAEYRPFRIR